jgi:LPXTG-motif cell wall-anchored protein
MFLLSPMVGELLSVSAYFQEVDKTRMDDTLGLTLVGLTFLIGLALLWWRLKREEKLLSKTSLDGVAEEPFTE